MNSNVKKVQLFSAEQANADIDLLALINRVIKKNWYVLGEEVEAFEHEFASYVGASECVSVANGTDALEIALRGIGVQKNDKVITVANAGFYASSAIHAIGAIPVYVDVSQETLTMSLTGVKEALEKITKPKAIIVTHLYGQLANIEELVKIADDEGIELIEDCAQAHGASRNGRQAGQFGRVGCFSFYPTKNLGALGDGGAIVTSDRELAQLLRRLRQYGWSQKYHVDTAAGCNSRLDEIQAAVLREKLCYLTKWNGLRRDIARRYNQAFADLPLRLPCSVGEDNVYHLYVLRVDNRDAFRDFLKTKGIMTDIHYPIADFSQRAYSSPSLIGSMEVTRSACSSVVSLPCYPGMKMPEIDRVVSAVLEYFSR